jgi:LPS-assembly lipoprotein
MQIKIIIPAFAVLAFVILLPSCGWHLRGQPSFADADPPASAVSGFSLVTDDIYSVLYRTFKSTYEKHRVNLANTDNSPQLKLLSENTKTRILSLGTELDPAESELAYSVHYQITFPGQTPQLYNVQLFRNYIQDKNRASASDKETQKLIDEMRIEAAEKVLSQINTLLSQQKNSAP